MSLSYIFVAPHTELQLVRNCEMD